MGICIIYLCGSLSQTSCASNTLVVSIYRIDPMYVGFFPSKSSAGKKVGTG